MNAISGGNGSILIKPEDCQLQSIRRPHSGMNFCLHIVEINQSLSLANLQQACIHLNMGLNLKLKFKTSNCAWFPLTLPTFESFMEFDLALIQFFPDCLSIAFLTRPFSKSECIE